MYRTLKLIIHVIFLLHVVRCAALFGEVHFVAVRTSGYRKTDCIRVNCDIYGNTSGIEEERQALPTFSKNFKRVATCFITSFYIFFVTSLYIHSYIRLYIHTYIRGSFEKSVQSHCWWHYWRVSRLDLVSSISWRNTHQVCVWHSFESRKSSDFQ